MSQFFNYFPTVPYDIAKSDYSTYQNPTNIFFRIGMIKDALDNISSYYLYDIKDDEKPEILADKVYGTPEAHWIILMANERHDGSYDWPLNYSDFNNYIADKYRTIAGGGTDSQVIAWSQGATANSNSVHHYEKVVDRTDAASGTTTTFRYVIDYTKKSVYDPSDAPPYDYYTSLSESGDYSNYTVNGSTVREKIYRNIVTVFDYEIALNESKRSIKIIKPEYYQQIARELVNLAGTVNPNVRKLV